MYTFPYEKKRIDEGILVDPRITLELQTRIGFLSIKFLLDSGADVTTLPLDPYAQLFSFIPKKKQAIRIGGVEGRGVKAYPFQLTARIQKQMFQLRCYFIESRVDPLLGRLDVWDKFSITFDNRNHRTIIIPI